MMNRSPKKTGNWVNMRELLSQSLGEIDAPCLLDKLNVHWTLTVGRQLAAVSRIDRLESQTLYIRVADKSWVPALESLRKNIISELNRRAGKLQVSRLVFRADGVQGKPVGAMKTPVGAMKSPASRPAATVEKSPRRRKRNPRARQTMAALSL